MSCWNVKRRSGPGEATARTASGSGGRLGRSPECSRLGLPVCLHILFCSAQRPRTDPIGGRRRVRGLWRWSRRVSHLLRGAPGAPGTAAARAHSQGHLTEGPGLTPPPAFLLAFICLPRPNCFQICNFKGSGTPLGRALLAPRGPQSNALRERTAGPAGRQGSGQAAGRWAGLGAGKAFPARGAAELSGAAQPLPDPAGLWRGPHGLWAQGMSPRATSEAIAGAVQPKHPLPGPAPLVAAMPSPPRRARPPTPPPTWEPGGRRGPGALWIGGSARPPHPIPEHHSESLSPVGRPQADLL